MSIALGEDQNEIAAMAEDFGTRYLGADLRTGMNATSDAGAPEWWSDAVESGLLSLHIPEEAGGQGLKVSDAAVVAEELAYRLAAGPVLPSLVASALLAASASHRAGPHLEGMAGGKIGTFATPASGFHAAEANGGWVISGRAEAVPSLAESELVLIRATVDEGGEGVWFALPTSTNGLSITPVAGTDLTRSVAHLDLAEAEVHITARLDLADGQADTIIQTFLAAEAAGLMRWAVETACSYSRLREQFGAAIGSFQATKHKLARMSVTAELAASAAWSAAVSLTQDPIQQGLASAAAAATATSQAPRVLTDAVTIFGGIGFTWEHDVHLYLRRSLSNLALAGDIRARLAQLGEASLVHSREVVVQLPDDEGFREKVATILDRALQLPEDGPGRLPQMLSTAVGARRDFLVDNGLVASHWPRPYGLGASPAEQLILAEEYARRGLTEPNTVIGEWAMPTILAHGTTEQKERFSLLTLRGELFWCQLFSEPGAGSDLASLATKATKVEGGWQLSGQKVWTSNAQLADWGICLARTNPDVPKHKGLGFFLVDMRAAGVEIRPIRQSNGDAEFSEVFLSDVFVPDHDVVGDPGQGWLITMTTLANERTAIGGAMSAGVELPLRDALLLGEYSTDRNDALRCLGEITAKSIAIGAMTTREALRRVNGLEPGAGSSLAKVATALVAREAAEAYVAIAGERLALGAEESSPAHALLNLPQALIGGGTVEIQLNVIAERVLGMPRQ